VAKPEQPNGEVPRDFANVTPDISAGAGQLRLIIQELKNDIKDIKDYRHTDFVAHISLLGGSFLLLAGMIIFGYFKLDERIGKSDDRIHAITNSTTRIDTKLEDLLQRIPPVPTPAPKRN
jgi:hypothetical protein